MFKKREFDFDKYGAFFAFGTKQFKEQKKAGVKYTATDFGLIVPTNKLKQCLKDFSEHNKKETKREIKEIGIDAIIKKEYFNYEIPIGDIEDLFFLIEDLGITKEYLLKRVAIIRKEDETIW